MKKNIVIMIGCFFSFFTGAQNLLQNESIESDVDQIEYKSKSEETINSILIKDTSKIKKPKAQLLESDSSKFRHTIDLRYVYDITLGYNFSYHFLPKRLGVGVRTGLWYKKKDNFPGGIYSRYGMKFSGDLYLDLTIWRSISLQMGIAFQNELLWPAKDNPIQGPGKTQDWAAIIYIKPTFIFYKHYLISAGVNCFSFQPYDFYSIRPIVSIGYKF